MKLVMITPRVDSSDPVHGFIVGWVMALARRVEWLWVITPRARQEPLPENVTVCEVGRDYGKGETVFHALRNFHRVMWRLTREEPIDGIFTHMFPKFAILAAPYAKLRGVPLVMWYAHGTSSRQLRLADHLVTKAITSSPEGYPLYSEHKVIVVGQGIDTGRFHPGIRQADSFFRILSVGRLSPIKRNEILIEATRILVRERNMEDLRVQIIGGPATPSDNVYVQHLREKSNSYGLEEYITFTGPIPHREMASVYIKCDLYVSFSLTNSLDKTVLEAMACGVPSVTSNPAFQAVFPADLGFLFLEPDSNLHTVVERVEHIARLSLEKRRQIGQSLRQEVERDHSLERLADNIRSVFQTLLGENTGTGGF